MPIYEYACEACGHRFEKLMKIGAEAPSCPECGEAKTNKRVSASAFVLKGSGWYKDHYGLKKGGSASSDSGAKSEGSAGSAEAKTPKTEAPAAPKGTA